MKAPTEVTPYMLAKLPAVVVEDNKFMRSIIGDLLRQVGFEKMYFAADGKEGIAQISTWLPRVVFTDWNMPVMNGLELINWVRRSGQSPDPEVPIILITGNNQAQEIVAARDAGVTEFIAKPVTTAAILHRLHSALVEPRKFIRSPAYIGPCRRRRNADNYRGPLRRLDDPLEVRGSTSEVEELYSRVEADIAGLTELTQSLDVKDRRQVREIRARTDRARQTAVEASDDCLAGAAESLTGYIDAMGAGGGLDPTVVKMHLASMTRLIELSDQLDGMREQVVDGLKKVVHKRMHQARGAA